MDGILDSHLGALFLFAFSLTENHTMGASDASLWPDSPWLTGDGSQASPLDRRLVPDMHWLPLGFSRHETVAPKKMQQ